MKCIKCGAELTSDTKFCSYCGTKIEILESDTNDIQDTQETVDTEYTETKLEEHPNVITDATPKKSIADNIKDKAISFWNGLSLFGKISTVAIIVFALLCLIAFGSGKTFAGIITVLQLGLVIVGILMYKGIIKTPKNWLHYVAIAVAIVLLIPYSFLIKNNSASVSGNIPVNLTEEAEPKELVDLTTPPSEDYIIACLEKVDSIDKIAAVNKFDDPNGNLGKEGHYISQVYFSSKVLKQGDIHGKTLIDKGTDAGGSVEVYRTEEDAKKRDEYLAGFDDNVIFNSGSHTYIGTVVVRTSKELSAEQQTELEEKIISVLTSGEVDLSVEIKKTGNNENEIKVPNSASAYKYENYEDVQKELSEVGFTNITTKIKYDIVWGITPEGEVDSVVIDGKTDYEQGTIFDKDAEIIITYHMKEENDPNKPKEDTTQTKEPEKNEPQIEPDKPKESSPLFYSTNTRETVKNGNSGVYSYKNKKGSYDIYWIINFDEGYVYWFTEGNGETTCDKVKIVSGDLNDKITITWHDGGDQWSWYLHFKYVNFSETLVVNDHNGYATEFTTTDLDDALAIRDTKTIKAY